ncbi:hypothetical protein L249_7808 [Ophiocordyceps polyrhachis-furcata BCC 54312]|uniref:Cytochrome b5 heme-binding domain-containing protein n=1 Tax=Ophiocordyceps polyrhachis-furcata BCC 54312 TaxID=1330021 RepID=A0A367L0V9_9HYPO|nr:hypothetical protein L249_7808 [Ophiocordyceps polyrhachis-furcata BCC 54312]
MALVALSLVLASVIYLVIRPPAWLRSAPSPSPSPSTTDKSHNNDIIDDGDNNSSNSESETSTTTTPRASPPTPSIMLSPPVNTMPPPPRPMRPPTLSPIPTRTPAPPRAAASLGPTTTTTTTAARRPLTSPQRQKVTLQVGFSPLDWARISGSGADLRGLPPETPLLRVTPTMLHAHTGRDGVDAWTVIDGKVYNITPYARFHPGGVPELMRGAARNATTLFRQVHPWVNYESMLAACLVGLLVNEPRTAAEKDLDAMD